MINALALEQRAESLASRLPPLLVAAERVAATVIQGVHGRRRVGQGETFWQFRRYEPGDAVDVIDWRQTAKTDRVFVRETEWEAAQSVWLWRDGSASMRWRSTPKLSEKAERANLLTLALMALLVHAGERVAMIGEGVLPSASRIVLSRFAQVLSSPRTDAPSLPPAAALPRHAQVVLVGDFLSPLPEVDAAVRAVAGRDISGFLLHVLDPAEETLPFTGRTRFEGLEREGETLIPRVETVRDDYRTLITDHIGGLGDIARAVGWTFMTHRTDHPPETALLALYLALSREPRF
ncbi:MAG: DUF58 domain-containing protein [Proteobacteria bacterium]|nr:DUF58 domain-containing protein [Pseudomonadota bacterium]